MKLSRLIKKVFNHIKSSIKTYNYNRKYFSKEIARSVIIADYVGFLPIKNKEKYYKVQNDLIIDYLYKNYNYLIKKYNKKPMVNKNCKNNKYIWCFWYQGFDNVPDVVKKCVESIQIHSCGYKLVLLDKNNYSEYVNIPEIILKKVEDKIITLTHFSDILRLALLSQYGGVWVDSTNYIVSDVFKKFDNMIFNSNRINNQGWCGFFMGGQPNKLFCFAYEMLIDYNIKEDGLINYFLIDYVLMIANKYVKDCDKIIEMSNINESNIFLLEQKFNDEYNEREYIKLINSSAFFKLSYKELLKKYNYKNLTNYGHFISEEEN